MSRFTRLRPVNSIKHIFDKQGALVVDTKVAEDLVLADDTPTSGAPVKVLTGSTVGSIFLNVQVAPTSEASIANIYMYILKNPGGNLTSVDGNKVGTSDIKKFVLHQEMIMCQQEATSSIPRTLFKGVIKIPIRMKRMGTNDKLQLILYAPGVTVNYCVQCIYKEFR